MTTIYTVHNPEGDTPFAYPTKASATAFAQELAESYECDFEVHKVILVKLPARELACALVMNQGYAEENETVYVAKAPPKKPKDEEE